MPSEKAIVNRIKREVGKLRNAMILKFHGNPISSGGHPDLYGVIPLHYVDVILDGKTVRLPLARPIGAAFYIETKREGKTSTPRQSAFQRRMAKTGACVGEAHSWEEAEELLRPLLDLYKTTGDNT